MVRPSSLSLPQLLSYPLRAIVADPEAYQAPAGKDAEVKVANDSERLQLLTPFEALTQDNMTDMQVLFKAVGKCTTDHISSSRSMA
jgi:aconitate hydratase